jgi:hypothetical protein
MVDRLALAAAVIALGGLVVLLASRYQRRRASEALRRELHHRPGEAPSAGGEGGACPRVLYFRSDQCPSCETQARLWAQLDEGIRGLIESVDVDAEPERARAYGIMTLPTSLVITADGRVAHVNYGVVTPKKLLRQLGEVRLCSGLPEKATGVG